ncbi:COMM domain-containing protein 7 [Octopus bimaculoides]|uniref:COMM domain-containing protein n=1 Tax=Octopus bimaculoides TaxID=37653 RepID=A0A0L8IDY6_OCTBM|nr:COMM domain-containing protein 7 [Octopus bimaculoides]|eukprot:XP_014776924.1 PREDICTED: COMM domain-containing protein 7-like [Octopus bimaculoides]
MAATIHYGSERTEANLAAIKSDMQTLDKFETEQFSQLVQMMFAFLLDPNKSSQLFTQLETFAEENGANFTALKSVFKSLITIPNDALRRGVAPATFQEELISLGLSQEKAEYLTEQWKKNMASLSATALGQTLMVNQLVDMDWKFGVTLSSSELSKVGNTFIQLKLVVSNGKGELNTIYMELSLQQFYSFLHEMERAKASMEMLS